MVLVGGVGGVGGVGAVGGSVGGGVGGVGGAGGCFKMSVVRRKENNNLCRSNRERQMFEYKWAVNTSINARMRNVCRSRSFWAGFSWAIAGGREGFGVLRTLFMNNDV